MSKISEVFKRFKEKRKQLPENNPYDDLRSYMNNYYYGYDIVMERLKQIGLVDEFYNELGKIFHDQDKYYPFEIEKIEHISRTTFLAMILARLDGLSEKDMNLLITAVRYHEIDEKSNSNEKRGFFRNRKSKKLDLLEGHSREEKKIIEFVTEQYAMTEEENEQALEKIPKNKRERYKLILNYLKDASLLDRLRYDRDLNPFSEIFRNDSAKILIDFAESYHYDLEICEFFINVYESKSEDFKAACSILRAHTSDRWILENKILIENLQRRGVWENCIESKEWFNGFVENDAIMHAATQVQKSDFEELRRKGYNLRYKFFLEIVSSFEDGTLEKLRNEGRLEEIFSHETFKMYGKKDSFGDTLNPEYLSDEELLNKINSEADIKLSEKDFKKDYMLYKNYYTKYKYSWDSLLYCINLGMDIHKIIGLTEVINRSDLEALKQEGYDFALADLIYNIAEFTPGEYIRIKRTGNIKSIFGYDENRHDNEQYKEDWNKIKSIPEITISEESFRENYKLYKTILESGLNIFSIKEFSQYTIQEIYFVYQRAREVCIGEKLSGNTEIQLRPEHLIKVLMYINELKGVEEKERRDIILLIMNSENVLPDSRLKDYLVKKNRVYTIESLDDLNNYDRFCINKVLGETDISLQKAKSNLVNSLFTVECLNTEYIDENAWNIIDELYYYKKYKENGDFGDIIEDSPNEPIIDQFIFEILEIMDSQTLEEFKSKLSNISLRNQKIDVKSLWDIIRSRMAKVSKKDVICQLNKTKNMIDNLEESYIDYNGESIPIKILDGQEFALCATTAMPYLSDVAKSKLSLNDYLIRDNILNRKMNTSNRCAFGIKHNMFAHPKSVWPELEVIYGYLPQDESEISITSNRDLITIKEVMQDGTEKRISTRGTIQNRKFNDSVDTTIEDHNEMVVNGVYPRYIICFDDISEIALEKYKMLQQFYKDEGIDQEIEILLIKGRDKYLPQMQEELDNTFAIIDNEIISSGTLSEETIAKFFNKREKNLAIQTIQTINCSSYRDELLNREQNSQNLNQLASILEKVAVVIPKEYIGEILAQVDFILRRNEGGTFVHKCNFYNNTWTEDVDIKRFEFIRQILENRLFPKKEERNPDEMIK